MSFWIVGLLIIGVIAVIFNGYTFYIRQATMLNLIGVLVGIVILAGGTIGATKIYANEKEPVAKSVDLSQANNFELLFLSPLKEDRYVLETETIYYVNYIEDKAIKRLDISKDNASIFPSIDNKAYLKKVVSKKWGGKEEYSYEIVLPEDHYEALTSKTVETKK